MHHILEYIELKQKSYIILGNGYFENANNDQIDKNVFRGFYIFDVSDINQPKKLHTIHIIYNNLAQIRHYIENEIIMFLVSCDYGGILYMKFNTTEDWKIPKTVFRQSMDVITTKKEVGN